MRHWWKLLGVLLFIYSLVVGMLVPLKPGIVDATPSKAETGTQIELTVKGYNSHYTTGENKSYLKLDSLSIIAASSIKAKSANEMLVTFDLPANLPGNKKASEATLIVDNSVDGYSVLPTALLLSQSEKIADVSATYQSNISSITIVDEMTYPYRSLLEETIRCLYYHVPLWFGMIILLFASMIVSILFLLKENIDYDRMSKALIMVSILYGLLGLITGAIWAKNTWGQYWSFDIKQNMAAISVLIYFAYFVLRSSFEDREKSMRIAAVYNIFAFAAYIVMIFVIPRLYDSLHPGNGGNPAMGGEDLDNTMRLVFYPAIIGFTLIGVWMSQLLLRAERVHDKLMEY